MATRNGPLLLRGRARVIHGYSLDAPAFSPSSMSDLHRLCTAFVQRRRLRSCREAFRTWALGWVRDQVRRPRLSTGRMAPYRVPPSPRASHSTRLGARRKPPWVPPPARTTPSPPREVPVSALRAAINCRERGIIRRVLLRWASETSVGGIRQEVLGAHKRRRRNHRHATPSAGLGVGEGLRALRVYRAASHVVTALDDQALVHRALTAAVKSLRLWRRRSKIGSLARRLGDLGVASRRRRALRLGLRALVRGPLLASRRASDALGQWALTALGSTLRHWLKAARTWRWVQETRVLSRRGIRLRAWRLWRAWLERIATMHRVARVLGGSAMRRAWRTWAMASALRRRLARALLSGAALAWDTWKRWWRARRFRTPPFARMDASARTWRHGVVSRALRTWTSAWRKAVHLRTVAATWRAPAVARAVRSWTHVYRLTARLHDAVETMLHGVTRKRRRAAFRVLSCRPKPPRAALEIGQRVRLRSRVRSWYVVARGLRLVHLSARVLRGARSEAIGLWKERVRRLAWSWRQLGRTRALLLGKAVAKWAGTTARAGSAAETMGVGLLHGHRALQRAGLRRWHAKSDASVFRTRRKAQLSLETCIAECRGLIRELRAAARDHRPRPPVAEQLRRQDHDDSDGSTATAGWGAYQTVWLSGVADKLSAPEFPPARPAVTPAAQPA